MSPPSGNDEPVEQRRVELGEHVALVLARVAGGADERPVLVARDARVVTGGEPSGAEAVGQLEHRVEANLTVAAHARVRSAARGVAVEEVVHHLGAEALAQVERDVRDAHARARGRARRARPAGSSSSCSPSVAGSDQSSSVTAITSSPASSASWAAAALSTPPLIATRVRRELGSDRAAPSFAAAPSAR